MLGPTLLLLALLTPLTSAGLSPENVLPGKVLSFQYLTQAHCDLEYGASNGFRVAVLGDSSSSSRFCGCVKEAESAAAVCPYGNGPASLQAYCLQTIQGTLGGQPDSLPTKASCDLCLRSAGSPGVRSVPCQDSRLFGKVISSGACATGRLLYQNAEGQCRCELAGQAPSSSKKCPLPKAGGYATCRDSVEYFYQGTSSGTWVTGEQYRGPTMKCEMRCNSGLHLSPSEKPVTCCKALPSASRFAPSGNGAQQSHLVMRAPPPVLSFQYLTQAHCDLEYGASNGFRVAVLGDSSSSSRFCGWVKEAESAAAVCPYGNGPASLQAYCLQTIQGTLGGQPDSLPTKASCDLCLRSAGSPGVRSVPCQDSRLFGKVISSGACATGRSLYQNAEGQCRCELRFSKKCPLPKTGGYATCRDSVEYFYQGTSSGTWVTGEQYRGPTMKCEMRCNSGLHLSPSEKPVTCCKAASSLFLSLRLVVSGYRSNSAGVCAKSTDGKQ
ncbi:hypothetical protein BCR35DRAFT_340028 [Leucosporidium creatinivorum]|uniref:Uncharacterized protein n=1 Tax=Leucosporidium creatinivorum TaxID=106004 RepID=A0A1Y2FL44_9BASI|nr:hypothetical protein BCR35DRAFT_340028 [Leucosporidium creatinivorum]